jgi:hypothetical protein
MRPGRTAVELAGKHLPGHSSERGEAEVALGIILVQRGAHEEDIPLISSGYQCLLAAHGEAHPMTQWARAALESHF